MNKNLKRYAKLFFGVLGVSMLFHVSASFAADAKTIGTIAQDITKNSMKGIAQLISAAAMVAGMGFAVGAVFKFKAHKDNPQQVPVGTPIALLFIAAVLIFLPNIFGILGKTIFGDDKNTGKLSGSNTFVTSNQ